MPVPLRSKSFLDDEPVKLTICSIAFNHRPFIEKCLDGFLDQICDFRVEIIVYDDASTDGTADLIRDYAKRFPTIFRIMLQSENLYSKGVNPYYGFVLPAAQGEYIAFCDGDDFWDDPNKLAKQVSVLEAESDTVLTYGPVRAITDTGVIRDYKGGLENDLSASELKAAPPINTLTACFRNIFRNAPISLFLRTSTIGDLTVWAMLGYYGNGRFLADLPPANYRIHDKGLISMQARERQLYMTAISHFHVAAYHHEQDDEAASQVSVNNALQFYNQLKLDQISVFSVADQSPKALFKLWRRALKRKIKNVFS